MNARRFFGANSREALREVKRELGAEAVIVSNRAVPGGVEILALPATELAPPPSQAAAARTEREGGGRTAPHAPAADATGAILAELHSVRAALEAQIAMLAWNEGARRQPTRTQLAATLLAAGLSAHLARQLAERLPDGLGLEEAQQWARAVLAKNLVVAAEDEIVTRGGVYALLGPTGVGKTTTTAKLAARCVARVGAERLALLTTDSYRIGGHEQLRIYARILGVPMHVVPDADDLRIALHEFRHKHLLLIDTVGAGQRDQMVAEQLRLLGPPQAVRRVLVLSAAAAAENLDDVVRAYGSDGLHGAIVTKVDEALSLGAVLDVLIRHRLAVHYIADGQRVPEDLHPAASERLAAGALRRCAPASPAFALREDEIALALAGAQARRGAAWAQPSLA
jgi:flagellar biosynthesis protein FlhF